MLLNKLEHMYKNTKDFQVLEESFQNDEPYIECPNIQHSIVNLLRSTAPCVTRWALYKKCSSDIRTYEKELLNLLHNSDQYIYLKSCQLLTKLYENEIPLTEYFTFIKIKLKSSQSYDEINQLLFFVSEVLPNKQHCMKIVDRELFDRNIVKIKFAEDETFLGLLRTFLNITEIQYYTIKILWVLSFNKECLAILDNKKIIHKIIEVMKEKTRDKLTRLSMAIIKNCIEREIQFSICTLHDIIGFCENKFEDEDMINDQAFIKTSLVKILKNMSEIDCYLEELFSGKLEESPYHYNDEFWINNYEILVENKIKIVKAIRKYIRSSDPFAICIGANDLFRLVKAVPEIGELVIKYNLKDDLFNLSNSRNPDVRFHAIQALASCIVIDWEEIKE